MTVAPRACTSHPKSSCCHVQYTRSSTLVPHPTSSASTSTDDLLHQRITEQELETAAFTVFLLGRMMGAAAEIDDHLNRGRNMDTRTPASRCKGQ